MQNFKDPVRDFIDRIHNSGQGSNKRNYLPVSEENTFVVGEQATVLLDADHTDFSGKVGQVVALDGGMVELVFSKGVTGWFYYADLNKVDEKLKEKSMLENIR